MGQPRSCRIGPGHLDQPAAQVNAVQPCGGGALCDLNGQVARTGSQIQDTPLFQVSDDLFGLLKPFAYTTIASGICGVTVILMPIGMLIGLAALIIEGMIFLRAKEQVEFV